MSRLYLYQGPLIKIYQDIDIIGKHDQLQIYCNNTYCEMHDLTVDYVGSTPSSTFKKTFCQSCGEKLTSKETFYSFSSPLAKDLLPNSPIHTIQYEDNHAWVFPCKKMGSVMKLTELNVGKVYSIDGLKIPPVNDEKLLDEVLKYELISSTIEFLDNEENKAKDKIYELMYTTMVLPLPHSHILV